ncbi:MAG: hypothetical protein IKP35_02750 [Alphaproteobacteria bacterium]|nr:hypothetical protein [Alphaproteobacteria bacterium]MBR6010313.1 hypothetical protein [Alphaproteobacteria bacterium]
MAEIIKFNKQDFLTARQLALKEKLDPKTVEKAAEKTYKLGTKIMANGHKTKMVIKFNNHTYKIHPLGTAEFLKIVYNNQKAM